MSDKGVRLSRAAVKRTFDGIRSWEQFPKGEGSSYSAPYQAGFVNRFAKIGSTAIAARDNSTPSTPKLNKGKAILYYLDRDDSDKLKQVNGSTEVDVYNLSSTAVAANAWVIVSYCSGIWVVTVEDCS